MLKVSILSPVAKAITWGAKPGREAGSMRVQEAWVYQVQRDGTPEPFPVKVEISLDRAKVDAGGRVLEPEQAPYVRGDYTLHPSSVYVGRDGRPAVSLRLTPMQPPATR